MWNEPRWSPEEGRSGAGAGARPSAEPAAAPSVGVERLTRLALDFSAARDLDDVLHTLRDFVKAETPMNGLFVSLYDPDARMRTCVYAHSEGQEVDVAKLPPLPLTDSPHSRAVETGRVIVTDHFDEAMVGKPRVDVGLDVDPRLPLSSVAVPMIAFERVVGAFEVQSVERSAFTPGHVASLRLAASLAALAIENLRLLERERQARQGLEEQTRETRRLNEALERKVAERTSKLAELNRELEAFSHAVAHDLRAPLRAVEFLGETELKDHGDVVGPEGRQNLEALVRSAQRMSGLVEALLALARTTGGDLRVEDVDLAPLARGVVDELRAQEPGREAEVAIESPLAARGDPRLLRIVLDNLLRNAWKFSRHAPATRIAVGRVPHDGGTAYFVRDAGIGFDMAKARRLFSPFHRLEGAHGYEGTGIGLATVARVVRRHGGRVWAEARPGEGATFYFTLDAEHAGEPDERGPPP